MRFDDNPCVKSTFNPTRWWDEIEIYTNEAIREIKSCLENVDLSLADYESQEVRIINRKKNVSIKEINNSQTTF